MVRAPESHVAINGLVGGRFVNGGRSVGRGLDCWGLVIEVFRRYGITVPDFTIGAFDYKAIDELAHEAIGFNTWEEVHQPRDKDAPLVVLMRMHPGLITHAGVFLGKNRIIHTMKATGTITSRVDALKSRITGYYRHVKDN